MTKVLTYTELSRFETFEERFNYLRLNGSVGMETFGYDRHLNQRFYRSLEWKRARDHAILRDSGCDLGILDREIHDKIYVHHMNPITGYDLVHGTNYLLDPNYLITTTHTTHNAIHYGDESLLTLVSAERRPGDTTPWR